MAATPEGFAKFQVEVVATKGECQAGHLKGQVMELSCWDAGGMCGFFYHDIFPTVQTLQFGGTIPWAPDGKITLECPDRFNAVTIELKKKA